MHNHCTLHFYLLYFYSDLNKIVKPAVLNQRCSHES